MSLKLTSFAEAGYGTGVVTAGIPPLEDPGRILFGAGVRRRERTAGQTWVNGQTGGQHCLRLQLCRSLSLYVCVRVLVCLSIGVGEP